MTAKYDYTVIEDSGGNLFLFVFDPDTSDLIAGYSGFEHDPGQLTMALNAIDDGDDTHAWDGRMDEGLEQWEFIRRSELGYMTICSGTGGVRHLRYDLMGRAGHIEFGEEPSESRIS